ncbi:MAG TPA: aspartate-semialdehyde dehydrogenase [Clostridiaceae bacterium]|nr:aspartate-semialdehyde dehydrogenase [Clostridiaceae bacterium]
MRKFRVGIIGATGHVGQRFILLLQDHPWFELSLLMASPRSKGKTYLEAVGDAWRQDEPMPESVKDFIVYGTDDLALLKDSVDFVFSAVDMKKDAIIQLEESIAKAEIPVVSNNSAMRWTPDVPLIMPEINPGHTKLIEAQRKRLGTKRGFVVVKPNCSIQSYVPALTPLMDYGLEEVFVATYQAVSGAGRRLADWPEMHGNVIPFIGGEEEKSEREPLRVWGEYSGDHIELATKPVISAQCFRVPVEFGHLAAVFVRFKHPIESNDILMRWRNYTSAIEDANLPSAPHPFLHYFEENDRPQPKYDASSQRGMGISIGRLREDPIFDYKFVCLSHNTVRGAAGGAVLTAELLVHQGWLTHAR